MKHHLMIAAMSVGCTNAVEDSTSPATTPDSTESTVDTGLSDTGPTDPDPTDTGSDVAPVANCDVSAMVVNPPFDTVSWEGTGSYDPLGQDITSYSWTLTEQPQGSAVSMPSGSGPDRDGFAPDLAGTYAGQLVVQTADGRVSEPCSITLSSIPATDLWVEMYWSHANDDMDLHLIRGTGSIETNQDCYFSNCTSGLSWGSSGPADDPSLDLDDIPRVGPENINIHHPENITYKVVVHDYPCTGPYDGDNDVTVNIYTRGTLAWTGTHTIAGEDAYVPFAEIDWATGVITSL